MSHSPKILMFGWEFPPHNSGGLGVACHGLAKALAQNNTRITFVLPKKMSVSADFLKMVFADIPSISVRPVDSPLTAYITSREYSILQKRNIHTLYGTGLFEEVMRYALHARDIAKEEEFDVIHAHDWLSFPAGINAKKVSGKPLVVHVHATEFDRTGGNNANQQVYEIEREGMEYADKIIAVSQYTKNIIVSHYGINPQKIEVVHNGIDESDYETSSVAPEAIMRLKERGNNVVLFMGRITIQKGPDYFIRAAARVLLFEPDTYFLIAGSGDMEYQMIREAAACGISDHVLFTGFVRGNERAALYRAADVYVLPSVSEPFGITPLESLFYGTPVIISKQSGVSETLSHALKVDFWDTDETANKIISVLRNKPLHNQLKNYGSQESRMLTWHKAADKCLKIYNALIHRTPVGV